MEDKKNPWDEDKELKRKIDFIIDNYPYPIEFNKERMKRSRKTYEDFKKYYKETRSAQAEELRRRQMKAYFNSPSVYWRSPEKKVVKPTKKSYKEFVKANNKRKKEWWR